jgi:hypothetical protein
MSTDPEQKAPALTDDIRAMVAAMPKDARAMVTIPGWNSD